MVLAQEIFPEQVNVQSFADNLLYVLAASAVVLVVAGLILIDLGTAKRRNVLDLSVQRFVGFLIGTLSYFIVGYAIWIWQFNTAFAVPNALWEAIKQWWLGGDALNTYAQNLDLVLFPAQNTFQIFAAFLAVYAGRFACSSTSPVRRGSRPFPTTSCASGSRCRVPFVLYLTWGSVSPITTAGRTTSSASSLPTSSPARSGSCSPGGSGRGPGCSSRIPAWAIGGAVQPRLDHCRRDAAHVRDPVHRARVRLLDP